MTAGNIIIVWFLLCCILAIGSFIFVRVSTRGEESRKERLKRIREKFEEVEEEIWKLDEW